MKIFTRVFQGSQLRSGDFVLLRINRISLLVHAASELLCSDMLDSYRTSRPEFCRWSFVYEWLAPKQGWPTSREICARNSKNLRNRWICKIRASQMVIVTSWHLGWKWSYSHTNVINLAYYDLSFGWLSWKDICWPSHGFTSSRGFLGRSGASCSGGLRFGVQKPPWAERVHLRRKGWVWKYDKHEIWKDWSDWSRIQSSLLEVFLMENLSTAWASSCPSNSHLRFWLDFWVRISCRCQQRRGLSHELTGFGGHTCDFNDVHQHRRVCRFFLCDYYSNWGQFWKRCDKIAVLRWKIPPKKREWILSSCVINRGCADAGGARKPFLSCLRWKNWMKWKVIWKDRFNKNEMASETLD